MDNHLYCMVVAQTPQELKEQMQKFFIVLAVAWARAYLWRTQKNIQAYGAAARCLQAMAKDAAFDVSVLQGPLEAGLAQMSQLLPIIENPIGRPRSIVVAGRQDTIASSDWVAVLPKKLGVFYRKNNKHQSNELKTLLLTYNVEKLQKTALQMDYRMIEAQSGFSCAIRAVAGTGVKLVCSRGQMEDTDLMGFNEELAERGLVTSTLRNKTEYHMAAYCGDVIITDLAVGDAGDQQAAYFVEGWLKLTVPVSWTEQILDTVEAYQQGCLKLWNGHRRGPGPILWIAQHEVDGQCLWHVDTSHRLGHWCLGPNPGPHAFEVIPNIMIAMNADRDVRASLLVAQDAWLCTPPMSRENTMCHRDQELLAVFNDIVQPLPLMSAIEHLA
jgi:hypothetical protein